MVLLFPRGGPPLPTLSEPFPSVTVLAVASGSCGAMACPALGAVAAPASYSNALLALKGMLDASSSVPASLASRSSDEDVEVDGSEGPPMVARLLRRATPDFNSSG
jgi:hypothetical protein